MKNIVFFDIDGTLIKGQSQLYLVKFLFKKGKVNGIFLSNIVFWFILYKLGLIKDPKSVMRKSFVLLKNWKINDVDKLFKEFFYKDLVNRINKRLHARLKAHQMAGDEIVFITNIMEPLARVIAGYFSVKKVYSSKLEINNNVYTGKIVGDIVYEKRKAEIAKKILSDYSLGKVNSIAYADHMSDKQILEVVKQAVVVNPKKELYNYALSHSWEIIK